MATSEMRQVRDLFLTSTLLLQTWAHAHDPHGSSQLPGTPAPKDLKSSSGLHRQKGAHVVRVHTYIQAKCSYTEKKSDLHLYVEVKHSPPVRLTCL